MKKILIVLMLSLTISAQGIDRKATMKMIDSMVQKGMFTKAQADLAKKKLLGLSDKQWSTVQAQGAALAKKMGSNNPKVENNASSAAGNIDFNSKNFKDLQKEVSKSFK